MSHIFIFNFTIFIICTISICINMCLTMSLIFQQHFLDLYRDLYLIFKDLKT